MEGSLLLPLQAENNSNEQDTVPGAAISLNLHLSILKTSQYITLGDAGQHSFRMMCWFHSQQNCFLDYFDDPVPDGSVIYPGDIPFQYSEKEGTYAEVIDNPTGNVFPGHRQGA